MATRSAEASGVRALGDDSLEAVVESTDVVLVEFTTDWCGTCDRMAPALDAIAADTDVAVVTVDVESHLETAIEHGAQQAPTFVCFVDGRPTKRLRGAQTESALRTLLAPHLE